MQPPQKSSVTKDQQRPENEHRAEPAEVPAEPVEKEMHKGGAGELLEIAKVLGRKMRHLAVGADWDLITHFFPGGSQTKWWLWAATQDGRLRLGGH